MCRWYDCGARAYQKQLVFFFFYLGAACALLLGLAIRVTIVSSITFSIRNWCTTKRIIPVFSVCSVHLIVLSVGQMFFCLLLGILPIVMLDSATLSGLTGKLIPQQWLVSAPNPGLFSFNIFWSTKISTNFLPFSTLKQMTKMGTLIEVMEMTADKHRVMENLWS